MRMYWVLARPWVGVCVPLTLSLSHSQQFIKYPKSPKISVSKSARLVPGGGGERSILVSYSDLKHSTFTAVKRDAKFYTSKGVPFVNRSYTKDVPFS